MIARPRTGCRSRRPRSWILCTARRRRGFVAALRKIGLQRFWRTGCEFASWEQESRRDWENILFLQTHNDLFDFGRHFGGAGPDGVGGERRAAKKTKRLAGWLANEILVGEADAACEAPQRKRNY